MRLIGPPHPSKPEISEEPNGRPDGLTVDYKKLGSLTAGETARLYPHEDVAAVVNRDEDHRKLGTPSHPKLNPDVFWGPIGKYVETMAPTTEAPLEYHYAVVLAVCSVLYADHYLWLGGTRLHPTFQIVLAGSTGVTHKTTCIKGARRLLGLVNDDYNAATPPILEGIGSREGILKQLQSINNNGSHPALWLIPEFTGLLNKAKSKATATLTETILQLADRPPEMSNYSLSEPIRVENPAVTILGDSTVENLTRTFSTTALTNGFLNRLSIFVGERGEPNPIPPRINETALRDVAADLKRSLEDKEVKLDQETESLWIDHYETEVYQTQQEPGGEVFARVGDRILQIAMIYALSNNRSIIEKDDLETAIKVVRYLTDCTRTVAQMVGQTDLS